MSGETGDFSGKAPGRAWGKDMLCRAVVLCIAGAVMLAGCGAGKAPDGTAEAAGTGPGTEGGAGGGGTEKDTGAARESAEDAEIDFEALRAENPDIFAWLYIPGTDIDCPVLQSEEADDYYESHDAGGEENEEGAVYTELANLRSMCDFNTVLHGKTDADGGGGLFADLYRFADPDFFAEHETVYIYLEGNLLTYTVFAAWERENTSLIRTYDFTWISGCREFLDDMYGTRAMGMNFREGWEDVTPYHFLITLTTRKGEDAEKQFVVVAALVDDAAGTIDRAVAE